MVRRITQGGRDEDAGVELDRARHPCGDHGGGASSGEQRPEKVSRSSWSVVVRGRDGVGGCYEGEE
jgi:hypothetical protein